MTTVTINASTQYDVKIGSGLLSEAAKEIAAVTKAKSICIVSDHTVWALHGEALLNNLSLADFQCTVFTFPSGEQSKNAHNFISLLEFLADCQLSRSDCLIALGGGVVGDLTGFAAATYLRGIDYIQIPTTLLAAVDSSVGGKTAIDLNAGKNLAGAFYQPKLVLCDTDILNTLHRTVFTDGCAEVIKYAVLFDRELFAYLKEVGTAFNREKVITRCVELKRDVVAADEFDRGHRMLLNLGHTVGHGIEASSGYTISHGCAVAAGMAIVSRASAKHGYLDMQESKAILALIEKFDLPICSDFSAAAISTKALSDKKRSGDTVNMILPFAIGDCRILPVPTTELEAFIEEGL